MPSILRSDRTAFLWRLLLGALLSGGLLWCGVIPAPADEPIPPATGYSTLALPVSNFGFRGVARDRFGTLYLSSTLKNGLFVLPPSCRNEDCATLVPLAPSLSDPGDVVADPVHGGAYVLLRMGDRVDYLPRGCLSSACLRIYSLPERPAYPFRAVYDTGRQRLAVLDRLSNRIVLLSGSCRSGRCLSFLPLPSGSGSPSGLALDPKRDDLWVTYSRGLLARIPSSCRRLSCELLFPPALSGLVLSSPAVSKKEDRLYLSAKDGGALGWVDLAEKAPKLRMTTIEPTSGKIVRLVPLPSGGVYLVTGGEHPHGGFFRATTACKEGCFDLRLFPGSNGTPSSLSPGGHDDLWMTVDDRDTLFRLRLSCHPSGAVLLKPCVGKIPFEKIETLYHARYHQEIQVPSEPSPDLSRPSD